MELLEDNGFNRCKPNKVESTCHQFFECKFSSGLLVKNIMEHMDVTVITFIFKYCLIYSYAEKLSKSYTSSFTDVEENPTRI
jgi:hypothetical protein